MLVLLSLPWYLLQPRKWAGYAASRGELVAEVLATEKWSLFWHE